mmetsp:Transcript_15549/g.33768  ORF Transcript_15549/g.33768 Transcript_15549/m.33768 type:complete len:296 (-) Transcript_15549:345-1232(-)
MGQCGMKPKSANRSAKCSTPMPYYYSSYPGPSSPDSMLDSDDISKESSSSSFQFSEQDMTIGSGGGGRLQRSPSFEALVNSRRNKSSSTLSTTEESSACAAAESCSATDEDPFEDWSLALLEHRKRNRAHVQQAMVAHASSSTDSIGGASGGSLRRWGSDLSKSTRKSYQSDDDEFPELPVYQIEPLGFTVCLPKGNPVSCMKGSRARTRPPPPPEPRNRLADLQVAFAAFTESFFGETYSEPQSRRSAPVVRFGDVEEYVYEQPEEYLKAGIPKLALKLRDKCRKGRIAWAFAF